MLGIGLKVHQDFAFKALQDIVNENCLDGWDLKVDPGPICVETKSQMIIGHDGIWTAAEHIIAIVLQKLRPSEQYRLSQ